MQAPPKENGYYPVVVLACLASLVSAGVWFFYGEIFWEWVPRDNWIVAGLMAVLLVVIGGLVIRSLVLAIQATSGVVGRLVTLVVLVIAAIVCVAVMRGEQAGTPEEAVEIGYSIGHELVKTASGWLKNLFE